MHSSNGRYPGRTLPAVPQGAGRACALCAKWHGAARALLVRAKEHTWQHTWPTHLVLLPELAQDVVVNGVLDKADVEALNAEIEVPKPEDEAAGRRAVSSRTHISTSMVGNSPNPRGCWEPHQAWMCPRSKQGLLLTPALHLTGPRDNSAALPFTPHLQAVLGFRRHTQPSVEAQGWPYSLGTGQEAKQ